MKRLLILTLLSILCLSPEATAQTISEKKQRLQKTGSDLDKGTEENLMKVNEDLLIKKNQLKLLYNQVRNFYNQGVSEEHYRPLLEKINVLRKEMLEINEQWQNDASVASKADMYALWHQPDTTLEQLVTDYGSMDYVYVMGPDIAQMKLSITSSIPIPRSEWSQMVEEILAQNGIGIRQLNPYLRELYVISDTGVPVKYITNDPKDLPYFPQEARVAFLLRPNPVDVKRTWTFLNRFINPNTTVMQQIGRDILIIGQASDLQDLLRLYQFVDSHKSQQEYKLVPLSKIKAAEMAKVITAMFDQFSEEKGDKDFVTIPSKGDQKDEKAPRSGKSLKIQTELSNVNGLKIIVLESLSQALFLVGTQEEITKAEEMIRNIEKHIGGGREKVINTYSVKYSNTEELAGTLQQIYDAMVTQLVAIKPPQEQMQQQQQGQPQGLANTNTTNQAQNVPVSQNVRLEDQTPRLPLDVFRDNFYQGGEVVVDPSPVGPTDIKTREKKRQKQRFPNFITDEKTGTIIMVVEKDLIPKLMELIGRIDVPKKMVQIDVLLFERKINNRTDYGLNLLRIGSHASNTRQTGIDWNNTPLSITNAGILEFFISRIRGHGVPAYDASYKFLMNQEHVHINANPSVVTVNQTPAFISIVEEQSISTGINFIQVTNSVTTQDSFTRAQYGITLEITPTIHWTEEDNEWGDGINYITLETKVNFDTTDPNSPDPNRPNVTRREIKNDVLIGDGQTVILGGLRRKNTNDAKEAIPFLGEIPGFGKLFSINLLHDDSTEMFIFLTPRIMVDPCTDVERVKFIKLTQRPGDIPEFLWRYEQSKACERAMLFQGTMRILFGRKPDGIYPSQEGCAPSWNHYNGNSRGSCRSGEYDGR